MSFSSVIISAIIAQGVFGTMVLFLFRVNIKANRILGALVLLSSLWLSDTYFRVSGLYAGNPNLYFLPIYFSFAFGPLIYFYTQAITRRDFQFQKRMLLHFIPVSIQGALYGFLCFSSYEFKRNFWLEIHRPYTYDLEFNMTFLSLLIYSILSIRLIIRYQKWIRNQFSEISKIHLNWLKLIQSVFIGITLLWLFDALLREFYIHYSLQPISALGLGISMLVLAAGGMLQADVRDIGLELEVSKKSDRNKVDYNFDPDILCRIKEGMEVEKYYLDPELSLKNFAAKLGISNRVVSFHINTGLEKSFIDFVNTYRVDEVKKHFSQNNFSHLTIFGIALESGFNSKSTFNRVFKNNTGESPSAYKKNAQKSD